MKPLLLLGSTGSIGTQTLDLVRAQPGRFRIAALGAARSWEALLEQAREFRPDLVGLVDPAAAEALRPHLPEGVALVAGPDAMEALAREADYELAVHGIVGAAGLRPSAAVLESGRDLALANKESLVVAGAELMELARSRGVRILPVDSEHCAIFQCLNGEDPGRIRKILLTASGGPFRDLPLDEFGSISPERALQHPTWDMGPRITVGSATLMNKALEVVEAHHLFGVEADQIEVVVHRQSIVHSMVEFVDGSVMAQLGPPDMRGPIHYALHYPDRAPADLRGFDVDLFSSLTFERPDPERFPALALGFECVAQGRDAGCALNAADEVAVARFLDGSIPFQEIHRINRWVLERRPGRAGSIEELLASDRESRQLAQEAVDEHTRAAAR